MLKGKVAWLFFILALFAPSIVGASEISGYSSNVTRLEMDLALFDFEVFHLRTISSGPLKYLTSTYSRGTKNKITCYLMADPTIMDGDISKRKDRIKAFCESLFTEYQRRFSIYDPEAKPDEFGAIECEQLKPCNLEIHVQTPDPRYPHIAAWKCGSLTYEDAFLKD
jgi:hypothetical protein